MSESSLCVAAVRRPKWELACLGSDSLAMGEFLRLQKEYLCLFRDLCSRKDWVGLHGLHFDWWQFPIDDGSRCEFNLKSENDVKVLSSNKVWLDGYLESVRLVMYAWGWDVDLACFCEDGGFWNKWDIRLAKIIRSLWLFQQKDYFASVQLFANKVNDGTGFHYGRICLDEILHMQLPR